MSEAPVPPEKKVRNLAVGSGLHAARERQASSVQPSNLLGAEPDVIVCKEDKLQGELRFENLLHVEGAFSGKLVANDQAGIIVGPSGIVEANVLNISAVYVLGKIVGNIGNVEAVTLKSSACVHGDISCKTLEIEPGAVVVGEINVSPSDGSAVIDAGGNILSCSSVKPIPVPETIAIPQVKSVLVLLEPQFDFHNGGGSMPISGAEDDSEAFAELIKDQIQNIDSIVVVLDTHERPHVAQASYWTDHDSSQIPPLYTTITVSDVKEGKWKPRDKTLQASCIDYLQALTDQKRYTLQIKPEHCLTESRGHAVVPWVDDALQIWSQTRLKSPIYIPKCLNGNIDSTSFLAADVKKSDDPSTFIDPQLLSSLISADKVIICGLANSPSTHESIVDLIEEWGPHAKKLCIVKRGYVNEGDIKDVFWSELSKNKDISIRRPAEVFL